MRIAWRRLDIPGRDSATLGRIKSGWMLEGIAEFIDGNSDCRLTYRVRCDHLWRTLGAEIEGRAGDESVKFAIEADAARRWRLNGEPVPAVDGCDDIDLSFTPATNTLPIRRLALAIGEAAPVRAAWLRYPGFSLDPLDQEYRRTAASRYSYASNGGAFRADLDVNPEGLVLNYPGLWVAEPA